MSNLKTSHLNRLWIARKRIGLGQKSVARLLGYHCTSPISEYENGRLLPNLPMALKLSIIYNTPLSQLYASLYGKLEQEITKARSRLLMNPNINYDADPHEKDPLHNPYPGH